MTTIAESRKFLQTTKTGGLLTVVGGAVLYMSMSESGKKRGQSRTRSASRTRRMSRSTRPGKSSRVSSSTKV